MKLNNGNDVCTSKSKIADAFGKFFANVALELKKSLNVFGNTTWLNSHNSERDSTIPSNVFQFQNVSSTDVLKALQNLKRTKSPGLDDLPPGMLKDAAIYITEPLTYIINPSLTTGMIPSSWKEAKVLPVFKSGSSSVMDNYRPISVLPAVSKILERIVHGQLSKYLEENALMSPYQFGFRRKHSTSLAVTYLSDTIRKSINKGELTGAIFVDLRKAFDTVDHCRLIEKLKNYRVLETELDWFTDYLFNRHQTVIYDCHKSKRHPVFCGVPQGSILGPLLFVAYINDLPAVLSFSNIIMYADDTILFYSHKNMNDIQEDLDKDMNAVASWLNQNQLVINLSKGKTESMIFGTSQKGKIS